MIHTKPLWIFEREEPNNCVHIVIRFDSKTQNDVLMRFFRELWEKKNNLEILAQAIKPNKLNTVYAFRLIEENSVSDFFFSPQKRDRFMFIAINMKKKLNWEKIRNLRNALFLY